MTELKTLKDLLDGHSSDDLGFPVINAEDLKQEAIKWVKALPINQELKKKYCFEHPEDGGCYNIIEWIEEFFNLTEADLQ